MNFINCIYFNCSFILNNIEIYPITLNINLLNNCLFKKITNYKNNLKNFLILYFYIL